MRQTRRGNFFSQDTDESRILEKIKNELGQGDWKIEVARSGSVVKWVAEKITVDQQPR